MKIMSQIELFPPEYRDLVLKYRDQLHRLFLEYDVVIFMARKAICFYKALVISGYVNQPEKCEIMSSRVLTYDITAKLVDKRVIVVDDVVIKGESLNEVLNTLEQKRISADTFIMACRESSYNQDNFKYKDRIIASFAELSETNTLQLSQYITSFIEASMCPYNIDQPIYTINFGKSNKFENAVHNYDLIDISSTTQKNLNISSYVIHFANKMHGLDKNIDIAKIRILCHNTADTKMILAIPFVLFPEMTYEELDKYYELIRTDALDNHIKNDNHRMVYENKLKCVHYVYSTFLMDSFIGDIGSPQAKRLDSNDDFIFAGDISSISSCAASKLVNFQRRPKGNAQNAFLLNDYLSIAYDYLYSDSVKSHTMFSANNNRITSELLILSDLKKFILSSIQNPLDDNVFSNIIDILIDRGIIIPSIIHGANSTILRAYKCGEVYKLGEVHFSLFAFMLGEYSQQINRHLFKIELEKLCVLFFREASLRRYLNYTEESGKADEYSICYSKFGPRVSTSKPIYNANEDSVLASRLLTLNYIELLPVNVNRQPGRYLPSYQIKEPGYTKPSNKEWTRSATGFAIKLSLLEKAYRKGLLEEGLNRFINSYNDILVLLSIGLNRKDQLLSLLAELYLFGQAKINFSDIKLTLDNMNKVMDGIQSGIWKYICYIQIKHPLEYLVSEMLSDDNTKSLGVYVSEIMSINPDTDMNPKIATLIRLAGERIFEIACLYHFLCKKYNLACSIDITAHYVPETIQETLMRKIDGLVFQNSMTSELEDLKTLSNLKAKSIELIAKYSNEVEGGRKLSSK